MTDEFDDRTDDDYPDVIPLRPDVSVTVGDGWEVDATTDDTLLFTEKATRRSIEVGFRDLSQWFALLTEMNLVGDAIAFAEHRRTAPARKAKRTLPAFDPFAVMVAAHADAEAVR